MYDFKGRTLSNLQKDVWASLNIQIITNIVVLGVLYTKGNLQFSYVGNLQVHIVTIQKIPICREVLRALLQYRKEHNHTEILATLKDYGFSGFPMPHFFYIETNGSLKYKRVA